MLQTFLTEEGRKQLRLDVMQLAEQLGPLKFAIVKKLQELCPLGMRVAVGMGGVSWMYRLSITPVS
jgi:hypothetical protein